MIKHNFKNDYSEGAHPAVIEELTLANSKVYDGYGYDEMTQKTVKLLKQEIGREDIDINFFGGGTQTNLIAIDCFLRPHEAVIAADIAHINVHETGSIEATGHKIVIAKSINGKLIPSAIEEVVNGHSDEHMVHPKLVYLSNSMENGLVYTKNELLAIKEVCTKCNLFLFLDGARLGNAIAFLDGDLTLFDISNIVDGFYIGGTKNGMLFGEALVLCNNYAIPLIRYVMKQKGAIFAKTWVVAVQFYALFKDRLYYKLAENANNRGKELYDGLTKMGVEFLLPFSSNQIFPIFTNEKIEKLNELYMFHHWENVNESTSAVRLVTSWATTDKDVAEFLSDYSKL